jgi:serine/threonine-protein kinase
MGVVYKARHLALNRIVAIKMILSGGHVDEVRLTREARAIAAVQHPNIVQVFEAASHEGSPYLSLEFLAGGSLRQKLQAGALPHGDAARLVEQLAQAMQAAHLKGLIHRDLKPANVLFDENGVPKITDFGLAKTTAEEGSEALTHSGAVMGTPSYMPPEQAVGAGRLVDARTDVYGLGAILYECLTGRPPFQASSLAEILLQVLNEEPPSPRTINPEVPRDLETICLKCLEKEPDRRYGSAAELAEDLRRFARGQAITARPQRAGRAILKRYQRNPLTAWLAILVLLLLGLLVYFLIAGR